MNKTFTSPVNADNYIAGFGTATGARIRSINYETGELRFSLINAAGTSDAVNGITIAGLTEANAADAIRAAVEVPTP